MLKIYLITIVNLALDEDILVFFSWNMYIFWENE